MKHRKIITILTIIIIIISALSALIGLFSNKVEIYSSINTIFDESVQLHNNGIYGGNFLSMAVQSMAQDSITLIVCIPLLLISIFFIKKRSLKGLFLIAGTLGYFLYTYISHAVVMINNRFYLINVILMALSFCTFILCAMSIQSYDLSHSVIDEFPAKSLSIYFFGTGLIICLMWLGIIITTFFFDIDQYSLESYSTMCIKTLDWGFIVLTSFLTSILLWKKSSWGYLLSVVLIIKMITYSTVVNTILVSLKINGMYVSIRESIVIPTFTVLSIIFMITILKELE